MKTNPHINARDSKRMTLTNILEVAQTRPFLFMALTLYWLWINLAFQGPLFFPSVAIDGGFFLPSWVIPIVAAAVTYLVMSFHFKKLIYLVSSRAYIWSLAFLMTSGAILCFIWVEYFDSSFVTYEGSILYFIGSSFIGIGTACFLIEWGRIFGYYGAREPLFQGVLAVIASALVVVFLSFLPGYVGRFIFILIPLPMVHCFSKAMDDLPMRSLYRHGLDSRLLVPHKFLVTAFLHGLSLGTFLGAQITYQAFHNVALLDALTFIAAALLFLSTVILGKLDFNHIIYQIGFSIMALGMFLAALSNGTLLLGQLIVSVGFCYIHIIMWGLCSYMTKNFNLPSTWVVSLSTCFVMLGQLVGGITACVLIQKAPSTYTDSLFMSITFILLLAALLMFSSSNVATGWGIAKPVYNFNHPESRDKAVRGIAAETGLSEREFEVLAMLVLGRDRKRISEELFISEETVKSHVKNIYQKLEIHSRQELLDIVEERRAPYEDTV